VKLLNFLSKVVLLQFFNSNEFVFVTQIETEEIIYWMDFLFLRSFFWVQF